MTLQQTTGRKARGAADDISASRTYRRNRIAVSTVFAVHGAVSGTFASRVPSIVENLHLGSGELGIALLMTSLGALAAMPFTGVLIDRIGGRAATRLLIGAFCLILIIPAFAPSLPVLCIATLLSGIAGSTADVAMNAEGVLLQQRMGTSIMSSLHGLWSIGGFAAGGIGALAAYASVDVRAHFIAVSLVLLLVGQVACRSLPSPATGRLPWRAPAPVAGLTDDVCLVDRADAAPESRVGTGTEDKSPRFAIATGAVLAIALVGFCAVFGEIAGSDWSAVYMRDVLGAGHATAAMSYAIFAGMMAASRLVGDRVIRRFGPVRVVRTGAAAGTVGAVLIVLAPGSILTIIGFALMGVGVAVVVPLAFAAAGTIGAPNGGSSGGAQAGHAIAGVATIAYGAGLAAPSIIGAVASVTSLRISFILVCVLVGLVALGAPVLRDREPDTSEPRDPDSAVTADDAARTYG